MKKINNDKESSLESIIHGLFYLSKEAEKSDLKSISNLLLVTIKDITKWIDNNDNINLSTVDLLVNDSFIAAIKFLSKFSAIDDKELKNDVINEIQKHQRIMN